MIWNDAMWMILIVMSLQPSSYRHWSLPLSLLSPSDLQSARQPAAGVDVRGGRKVAQEGDGNGGFQEDGDVNFQFSHILGIIIPDYSYFSQELKPPTSVYSTQKSENTSMKQHQSRFAGDESNWRLEQCPVVQSPVFCAKFSAMLLLSVFWPIAVAGHLRDSLCEPSSLSMAWGEANDTAGELFRLHTQSDARFSVKLDVLVGWCHCVVCFPKCSKSLLHGHKWVKFLLHSVLFCDTL